MIGRSKPSTPQHVIHTHISLYSRRRGRSLVRKTLRKKIPLPKDSQQRHSCGDCDCDTKIAADDREASTSRVAPEILLRRLTGCIYPPPPLQPPRLPPPPNFLSPPLCYKKRLTGKFHKIFTCGQSRSMTKIPRCF